MADQILTICDDDSFPCQTEGVVYHWNGHEDDKAVHSILSYVEKNADELKAKYLSWINEFGETRLKGRRVIDHFAFKNGFSYWWMTSIVEKSFYRSPISDAIRLLALEEIIKKEQPSKVVLIGNKKRISKCVQIICQAVGINYEWRKIPGIGKTARLSLLKKLIPNPAKALALYFQLIFESGHLMRIKRVKWHGAENAVFFCSYFLNLDQKACSQDKFFSGYWGILPEVIGKQGYKSNWIHHYIPNNGNFNTGTAAKLLDRFNANSFSQGRHSFLGSFLSFRVICKVILKWFRLQFINIRLENFEKAFQDKPLFLSLYHLMKEDLRKSICGTFAISNLFFIELFDEAMKNIPRQKLGFYLYEGQAWERAFIHAWKKNGHGNLVGVAHSNVRFWDLRYFFDHRAYKGARKNHMPLPDKVAVNGPPNHLVLAKSGFPLDRLVEVEALRYLYINDFKFRIPGVRKKHGSPLKILVFGDYESEYTDCQLQLLAEAKLFLSPGFRIIFKPHPACQITPKNYSILRMQITNQSVLECLTECDVVYAGSATSASVDAYCMGLPVILFIASNSLNMSPLRGLDDISYVATSKELVEALDNCNKKTPKKKNTYFFLDSKLPRWKRLLPCIDH